MWLLSFTRRAVPLYVIALFCGLGMMTYHLFSLDVDTRRDQAEQIGQSVQDSMLVRAMIIQNSMPFVQSAGPFGYGDKIRKSQLNLDSVDNTYILFTMRRGWVFIALFLLIPVTLAVRASKAFRNARLDAQWMPLAAVVSVVCGIMAAMYTVWFGFAYSVLWMLMIGLVTSMCDIMIYGPPPALVAQNPRVHGFPAGGLAYPRGA